MMTACRNKLGLALAVVSLAVFPALAQQPMPLTQPFDPETMERADPPSYENVGRIGTDVLKAPNPEAAGTMDVLQGGFSATLWNGTSIEVVRTLIPRLPGANASPTVRSLERRLLLTAAIPPDGIKPDTKPSLVELRAERLLALGDLEGVAGLSSVAPASVEGAIATKVQRDAHLLAGRNQEACARLQPGSDPENARLLTFCHLVSGRTLEGNLALDLLRERKAADSGFIAAAEILAGLPPIPNAKIEVTELSPLHVALFKAAKMALPEIAVANAPVTVARAIAGNPATPMAQRVAAAERAEAVGLMSADDLRKLYLELTFAPDEMGSPMDRAASAGHGRALLFRAAFDQPDPLLKARFAARAIELAVARNRVAGTARVFEAIIAAIRPEALLSREAPFFARAFYALGRPEAAAKWLDIATADAAVVREAEKLWPLTALSDDPGKVVSLAGLAGWRASLAGLAPDVVARRNAVVLGVLAGLGAKVPDSAWLEVLSLPTGGPNPGLFALMQGAALDARLGGTLLAALATMGDVPLDRVDPMTLSEVISALAVVGLAEDARQLALEALLANGI